MSWLSEALKDAPGIYKAWPQWKKDKFEEWKDWVEKYGEVDEG